MTAHASRSDQNHNLAGYLLTSSGFAAEHQGNVHGLYDEIKSDYAGRVFNQRCGEMFIYKKNDKCLCDPSVVVSVQQPGKWFYVGDDGYWQNNDPTLHFLPLTPFSCILQPSIQITSTGPALTRRPDYLGTFLIVPGVFSAG